MKLSLNCKAGRNIEKTRHITHTQKRIISYTQLLFQHQLNPPTKTQLVNAPSNTNGNHLTSVNQLDVYSHLQNHLSCMPLSNHYHPSQTSLMPMRELY